MDSKKNMQSTTTHPRLHIKTRKNGICQGDGTAYLIIRYIHRILVLMVSHHH